MAEKKVKVKVDVQTNAEGSIAQLKELKKQLRETAAGSAEFKKLANEIDDLEDKLKGSKAGAADWIDTLEGAGGPIGMLGKGLNSAKVSFTSFNTALKASVIGLIVAAIGGLVAAFQKSEEAQKKLQPIFIAFEKILGGIFRALEPLIDAFLDLAMQALPYVTKGIGIFYSALVGLFTYIKEAGTGIAKIWQGIFTLDVDKALEGVNQVRDSFSKAADAGVEAYKRFEGGSKELTKTEKENLEERKKNQEEADKKAKEAADKRRQAAEKALEEKKKQMEAQDKLDEAALEKLKAEALAVAETEEQKFNIEKQFADKSYQLKLKDLQDKLALEKQGSAEAKAIQAEIIALQADKITKDKEFADKGKEIAQKAAEERKKQIEDNLALEEAKLNLARENGLIKEAEYEQKLFDIRKKAIVDTELLTNETLQKEKETLDNNRAAALANLQLAFQNEESELQAALDNRLITQEQFEAQSLELKNKFNEDVKIIDQNYQASLDAATVESLAKNKEFIAAQIDLQKFLNDEKKRLAEEDKNTLLNKLQEEFNALDRANKQSELDFQQDLERLAQQKEILNQQEAIDLQNEELTQFQRTEIRQKYADQRRAIADAEIATEKAAMMAKHEINMAYLGLFQQFGGLLSQIAGKNKGLAIAGVIIQQAASIGQIIASTGIANAKAVAASPLTFGMPWVAINTASAALSIASTIAGAVKSIQQINQAASQAGVQGGGGGGGSAAGAAPSIPAPKVSGAAAPQIQTQGGMNPNTQIAETIAGARAPIKAYVVSGEVSSQQALDRRTSRAATFTGG